MSTKNISASPGVAEGKSAGETILSRLRTGTAYWHEQLETQLDLLRPDLGTAGYRRLLARLYGYYHPWQQECWPLLGERAPSLVSGRRKAELLASDLRHFGIRPQDLPLCSNLPGLGTFSQALGSFYVLEGSTLGGQILARHFIRTLGLAAEGLSFFRGYGERTGFMWKRFSEELVEVAKGADEPAMVRSAQETFETLGAWMAEEDR